MFKTANIDSIFRPKLPFPGNGKGNLKCHGKGREIWGLFSRESREMGIFAHPCDDKYKYDVKLGLKFSHLHLQCNIWLPQPVLWKTAEFECFFSYKNCPFFTFSFLENSWAVVWLNILLYNCRLRYTLRVLHMDCFGHIAINHHIADN